MLSVSPLVSCVVWLSVCVVFGLCSRIVQATIVSLSVNLRPVLSSYIELLMIGPAMQECDMESWRDGAIIAAES